MNFMSCSSRKNQNLAKAKSHPSASTNSRMDGGDVAIAELVRLLTLQLKRPVIDKTDLKGTFDIHVTYLGTNPLSTLPTDTIEPSAEFGLTIFNALEQHVQVH